VQAGDDGAVAAHYAVPVASMIRMLFKQRKDEIAAFWKQANPIDVPLRDAAFARRMADAMAAEEAKAANSPRRHKKGSRAR
jgi:hypothetical protein